MLTFRYTLRSIWSVLWLLLDNFWYFKFWLLGVFRVFFSFALTFFPKWRFQLFVAVILLRYLIYKPHISRTINWMVLICGESRPAITKFLLTLFLKELIIIFKHFLGLENIFFLDRHFNFSLLILWIIYLNFICFVLISAFIIVYFPFYFTTLLSKFCLWI